MKNTRSAGILMAISSLPNRYGIGTFGSSAYRFVEFLNKASQKYWQILPLGHTSYGDSPYQTFSAFAGNPYYIDLDFLKNDGLLHISKMSKSFIKHPTDILSVGSVIEVYVDEVLLEKNKVALSLFEN